MLPSDITKTVKNNFKATQSTTVHRYSIMLMLSIYQITYPSVVAHRALCYDLFRVDMTRMIATPGLSRISTVQFVTKNGN